MRFIIILFLINFSGIINAQFWHQLTDFPGSARDDAAGFSINNNYYCGTGRDDGFNCTRDFYRFNGTSQLWETATPLPDGENRQYANGFEYNGNGYIFGGNNCASGYLNSFWMFESSSEQWISLPSLPADGRAGSVNFIIGDSLYLIGGQNTNGINNEVWRYCFTTQEWQQKNDLIIPGIWRGIAFSYANYGYIAAGKSSSNSWNYQTLKYDPVSDNWSDFSIQNFGVRTYIGLVQRDNFIYVFGGLDSLNNILNTFEKINLNDFSEQSLPIFSATPRKGTFCFSHNSDFYVTTGVTGNLRLKETWRIDNILKIKIPESNQIIAYPIPVSNFFYIEVEPINVGQWIRLTDNFGKTVLSHFIMSEKSQISISHLSNGTYNLIYKGKSLGIIKVD